MKAAVHMARNPVRSLAGVSLYDRILLIIILSLLGLGLLMVYSSSVVVSGKTFSNPFHFLWHQIAYVIAGFVLSIFILKTEIRRWHALDMPMLFITLVLLILVLIPGIGHQVNGSSRWLGFGPIGLQVSELAKLSIIIYIAGYLVRRGQEVRTETVGFIKPLIVLCCVGILLLREPDFGATTVILLTALGMLFLAGAKLWQFVVLFAGAACSLAFLVMISPYRKARLTGFLDPWANQFDSGYQLTQSLIAFGRGGWFGVGLGESVQKLFYLPEAHTDFLFAVLGEELGLIGVLIVIVLFALLVWRILQVGVRAQQQNNFFSAYLAYGISLCIGLQAIINIGVNSGLLPTKGLTLPLMSYGGSSLLMTCVSLAIVFRIDYETRLTSFGMQQPSTVTKSQTPALQAKLKSKTRRLS